MTKLQWDAIRTSDASYDGVFYYALKTTKTICRPSCKARTCNPRNVIIYDTLEAGVRDGFRPCQRCRPDIPDWKGAKSELAARAKAFLDAHYMEKFSLEKIAGALYIDRIYLAKSFHEVTGSTLLKYCHQVRCAEAARLLASTELSVEIIGNRVGYATASHFAKMFRSINGCTPSEYRKTHAQPTR